MGTVKPPDVTGNFLLVLSFHEVKFVFLSRVIGDFFLHHVVSSELHQGEPESIRSRRGHQHDTCSVAMVLLSAWFHSDGR